MNEENKQMSDRKQVDDIVINLSEILVMVFN